MNKLAYRVIFNRTLGRPTVVAENVSGGGKSGNAASTVGTVRSPSFRLITLRVLIAAVFGSVTIVHAQIVADPNAGAHRPTVDQTANGRPVVQITAPNAAGLSHNQYQQFNVGPNGAILNNARGITATQQGGLIDGNAALSRGSARIILNEVRGAGRSQLSGYTEVAGQRAEVIIANPNGITCSGCGFINTTRGVLTTGAPVFGGDGSLRAFRVVGGAITVNGLQGGNTDQLDLITRSVRVNGQLWANRLNVVAGANEVNYADLGVQVLESAGEVPTVAIDVAQLGGMYANKIHLIGTEAGVGVASMGTLAAQAGDISIDSRGKVTLNGNTHASGHIGIRSDDDVTNSGTIYAQQQLRLNSAGQVRNTGTLAAQQDLTIRAAQLDSSGSLAAGIDPSGHATQPGSLQLSASGVLSVTGQQSAGGNIAITGGSLNLAHARTSAAGNIALTATVGDIDHTGGNLQALGATTFNASGTVINDHGVVHTAQLDSRSARWSNRDGIFTQSGNGDSLISTSADFDNTGGNLSSNAQNLILHTGNLTNTTGTLQHAGSGTLRIASNALHNVQGSIVSNGDLAISAAALDNQRGRLMANGNVALHTAGALNNTHGSIQAAQALQLSATDIDNSAGHLVSLNTDGLTLAVTGQLTNGADGVIGGNGDVTLSAANLRNSGTITASKHLSAYIKNQLNNSGGRLASGQTLQLRADSAINAQGSLDAAQINATIAQFNNNAGLINADQLTLQSVNLHNQQGHITQLGTAASIIDIADLLDNSQDGVIQSNSNDLTLSPQQLDNRGGTIALAGTGRLGINVYGPSALHNEGGSIGSNGQLNITSSRIDNQGGTMFAQGRTSVSATLGAVDNRAGGYIGGSYLTINAAGAINNTAGKIEGTQTGLSIIGQSLQNASGTIQSVAQGTRPTGLSLWIAQGIHNGIANGVGGFIGSAGTIDLHAGGLDNNGGTLYADNDLTLTLKGGAASGSEQGGLVNTEGVIQGGANVHVSATGAIRNQQGRIEANGSAATLTVSGSNLDNSAGRIANSGTGLTHIESAGNIINTTAGTIGGNGDVTLTSGQLDNSTGGQIVAAGNLLLDTQDHLSNNAGNLYAGKNLQLDASEHRTTLTNIGGHIGAAGNIALSVASLDNSAGLIGSADAKDDEKGRPKNGEGGQGGEGANIGDITISASGTLTNSAGTIGSARNVHISASTLAGEGAVIAGQDALIQLQGNYHNTAANLLVANRDLTLTTTGNLINSGRLAAVRDVRLNANNIDNQRTGLINGGDGSVVIRAVHGLHNTGRIYGNAIVLGAQTVTNDIDNETQQAGVIASRNTLHIGAATIINREHALFQSMGDMVLGGALNPEDAVICNAAMIRNTSATIDAGGALTIDAATLINENNHFTTALATDPAQTRQVTEYRAWNSDVWYRPDQISWSDSGKGGIVLVVPGGDRFEKFYKRDYRQTVQQSVVTHSDPGTITSGGNMRLSGTVTNDKSIIIAGGTLSGNIDAIHNLGAAGEIRTTNAMTAGQNYYHWVSGKHHDNHYQYDNNGAAYDVVLPSVPLALQVWTQQENTQPVTGPNHALGNGVDANALPAVDGSDLSANDADNSVGEGAQHGVDAADGDAGTGTDTAGSHQTVGDAIAPLPDLILPNNALFIVHKEPGQAYLIETDPAFTNYKKFISSDYMLSRLSLDPQKIQKRLGDGFYEQKLINDQIAQLTGKRFLGNYHNNETQYQALMEAGIASAEAFQLTPGIALTAAQMAALTADIVWLVAQTVTLPDGSQTEVLAPVVYLSRASAGDIAPTGALMAAHDIDLSVHGSLDNGGTLQATDHLIVHATDIANSGNLRSTGQTGSTHLIATNDILNNGGNISGHRVGILAGRDVTLRTGTTTASSKNGSNIGLGNIASINADQLAVQAGRDVTLSAASVNVSGDASFSAGRDLSLNTVTTQRTDNIRYNDQNHLDASQTQVNGTSINAGGNLALIAGQDINASAATVNAGEQLAAVAGRDITVTTARQDSSMDQAIHTTSKGIMSSSSSSSKAHDQTTEAIGSSFTGNTIAMQSGRDITVKGSQVIAASDLTLNAGRDVSITSAQQTTQNSFSAEETSSGLAANFMSGLSYSKTAQDQAQTGTSVTQIGSDISGANVHISSGRDTSVTASVITADQDIGINAGRNINILAAANTETSDASSHSSGTRMDITGGANARFTNYGTNSALQNNTAEATDYSTSLLSANGGNLSLQAGLDRQYRGTGQGNVITQGAELLAQESLNIAGNAVDLQAIHNASNNQSHAETHSVTLGSSLTGALGGAVTRIGDMVAESQHTSNTRLQGALALKAGYDAYKLAGALPGAVDAASDSISATADVLAKEKPAAQGAGFGVSVSLGVGQSKQDSKNRATQARGTTAQAHTINITSRDGDILMEGAKLQANDISLDAARNIQLIAAANSTDLQSTNSGSNAGIGATLGSNGEQTGLSFQLGASGSKGHASGHETNYDNTQISATDHLTIKSGGDLTMRGAQLAGNTINADIAGDLNILTQQDLSNFDSKQENGGFSLSLCIPPICAGSMFSGSLNYARQQVEHNYQSAVGQSGIAAGTGGFNINVKGNTDLTGAALTSTARVDKNSLHTASLTSRDLANQQHTKAEAISISASTGGIASNVMQNVLGNLNGGKGMPKNNDQHSNTNSVISPATITITGSGDAATDANSETTATTLTERDASTANGALTNTLTLQQAQDLQRQQHQAQEDQRSAGLVGAVLANMVGDMAQGKWADGSPQKIALHGIVGLIEARIGGGSAAAGLAAGMTHEAMVPVLVDYLISQGYTPGSQDFNDMMNLGATLVGAASGALAGGGARDAGIGANVGVIADQNNRQLHPDEKKWIKGNASRYALKKGISIEQAQQELTAQADRQVQSGSSGTWDQSAYTFLNKAGRGLLPLEGTSGTGFMFYATPKQKGNTDMYAGYGAANKPADGDVAAAINRDLATRELASKATVTAAALAGTAAGIASAAEIYAAYKAAAAAYSMGTALGTGMAVGGGSYTGSAAAGAVYERLFGTGQDFSTGFDQRFSYSGLAAATTVGGLTGMYGTAMFGWAGVPNSIKNLATLPGFIIRANSVVAGKAAGSAAQAAVKPSNQ
ncbi:hemagglutinin repeat-containing protein [Glaciimonas immobilis]|uniref:Filamentous hemagglutinin n=1 Tax=Glaciimonas immobilis TaxID=728004 RepID=A0A840RM10_9BURK|nr:hemagglutinin repeat-containing protein [Glaciimonas immobilis]KAF3997986.1 filamentous hemagglutinin N-terminal domain-containing protein [Glaciimonas immobilis]MBB5199337.1 filamentous hemagglutinin [Glaciimonas immobilis]